MVSKKLGLRERLSAGFRTEFFIKTGVVLLGASINPKILVTALPLQSVDKLTGAAHIAVINDLRTWFLILAFVSIGLKFSLRGLRGLREAGWRPIVVSGSAAIVNLTVGLGLSVLLFRDFAV